MFKDRPGKVRNIGWVAIFFFILFAILFPVILLSQRYKFEVSVFDQAIIVIVVSVICQLLRRDALSSLFGLFNFQWLKNLGLGLIMGATLMFAPAAMLWILGGVTWQKGIFDSFSIASVSVLFIGVAVTEEVLFRGFIFQRLVSSIGLWPAQIILAGLFLLIHLNNPGISGGNKFLAYINIFCASAMFGLVVIRSGSLVMAVGFHFMANWVQGVVLGFGVSGYEQASFFRPVFRTAPKWLTGGSFGLEASLPGLFSVVVAIVLLYRWKSIFRSTV